MDKCLLIKPNFDYINEIKAFKKEMQDAQSSMDGTGPLYRMENIEEWLELSKQWEDSKLVPTNWVAAEQFIYVRKADNKIVGMIQFRHYFNEFLELYGGHIGYSVRPSERRKGYATSMLAECLKVCKEFGLEKVLVTCIKGNEGSKRTILSNKGNYESTVFCQQDGVYLERYWIDL
jgi:predicted acetyltransferase